MLVFLLWIMLWNGGVFLLDGGFVFASALEFEWWIDCLFGLIFICCFVWVGIRYLLFK